MAVSRAMKHKKEKEEKKKTDLDGVEVTIIKVIEGADCAAVLDY